MGDDHILVTGGSGFIGRSLVPALRAAGARVTVADLVPYPDEDVPTVLGDLRDAEVRDAAVTADLTGVVHLAARTSVLESVKQPAETFDVNVAMTGALLELARVRGVERFVLASTNAVVGDVGDATIHEDIPLNPLTPYGATKAAGEMLLSAYAAVYGMAAGAVRLTNVYGPGMAHKDSFVPRLMRAARDGAGVSLYGDGKQSRDLVHVSDVVAGFQLALRTRLVGRMIIGAGASVSMLDLVDAAREATGAPIPVTHVDAKPGEMPAVVVDISKARGFGYEPRTSLVEGLASVWAEFRPGTK